MPAADRSTYNAILRRVYTRKIHRQFNRNRILKSKMRIEVKPYAEGEKIGIPLHQYGGGGIMSTTGTALPTPQNQKLNRAWVNFVHIYGRIKVTGPAISSTSRKHGADVRALDFETRNLIKDLRDFDQRWLWGDGSGNFATLSSTAATATTITVADSRLIRNGEVYGVLNISTGVSLGLVKVTNVVHSTGVLTIEALTTFDFDTASTSYGMFVQGKHNQAPWGLLAMVSDSNPAKGNYGEISRTGNDWWKAQVKGNSGTDRVITLRMIQELIDDCVTLGNGDPRLLITTHPIWNQIADMLVSDKRFDGSVKTLDGWLEYLSFGGRMITKDQHCPKNKFFALDMSSFCQFQAVDVGEGQWMDKDGAILNRVNNEDAYEGTWYCYKNYFCNNPNGNGRLDDIAE